MACRGGAALLAGLALAALLLHSSEAQAQRRGRLRGAVLGAAKPEVGLRGGYDFHRKSSSLGGQVRFPVGPVDLLPSGDLFLVGGNVWQLNADAALRIGRLQALYAGGGYGVSDLDHGPNLLVGLEGGRRLPDRPLHGYLEGRWTFGDVTRFHLVLGVNIPLGRTPPPRRPRGR